MTFTLMAIGLCLIAVAYILLPLAFQKSAHKRSLVQEQKLRASLNVSIFKERQSEYQIALDQGDINRQEFSALELELKRNLLSDAPDTSSALKETKQNPRLQLIFAVLIPVIATLLYADFGLSWGAMADVELAQEIKTADPHDSDAMTAMVLKLDRRLGSQPENYEAWFLLAQSYMNMQQFEKSAKAFKHLRDAFPRDPRMASYYAEAIYMADERKYTSRSAAAIDATLVLNPEDLTMLEIKAVALFQAGKLAESVVWFKKAKAISSDESRSKFLQAAIARIEADLGVTEIRTGTIANNQTLVEASKASEAASAAADPKPSESKATRSLQILVEAADGVDAGASASVFVFARAIGGPPMPLAVQRMVKGALPKLVNLDESMAMMAGMGLANFDQVEVVARISSSGIANVSPDDYEAISAPIDLTKPQSVIKLTLLNKVKDR